MKVTSPKRVGSRMERTQESEQNTKTQNSVEFCVKDVKDLGCLNDILLGLGTHVQIPSVQVLAQNRGDLLSANAPTPVVFQLGY